ncbi:hypothetical protein KCP70_18635 [Salmonella enterica subsp. enterica]|nr:hypothetical protein KCP70_18635 [Salmonella enterica subsp. enterica]
MNRLSGSPLSRKPDKRSAISTGAGWRPERLIRPTGRERHSANSRLTSQAISLLYRFPLTINNFK